MPGVAFEKMELLHRFHREFTERLEELISRQKIYITKREVLAKLLRGIFNGSASDAQS